MKLKKAIKEAKQWNNDNPTQTQIKYISVGKDLKIIGSDYKPFLNNLDEWQACAGDSIDVEVTLAVTYTGSKDWKDTLREVK